MTRYPFPDIHFPLNMLPTLGAAFLAGFLGPADAAILYNDFDSGTSSDVGPAFQQVTNGAGTGGGSDAAAGTVFSGDWGSSTYGLNTVSSLNVSDTPGATGFNLVWEVSAADIRDVDNAKFNGWFFGVTNSTDASKDGLFNQTTQSLGIVLIANTIPDMSLFERAGGSDATTSLSMLLPTVDTLEDGFTLSLTFREDNTWSAYSTGLSNDFNSSGTATTVDYATPSQNLVANSSIQGASIGYTVESVTVTAIPEPSTLLLMAAALAVGAGLKVRCHRAAC